MNARNDPPVITGNDVERILESLRDPACYPHPVRRMEIMQTHISWVILTGDYAYKIKKPVNLGFLDFTSLEARRRFCEEELRLNRRFAPRIYLGVVPITGGNHGPRMDGSGPALEYAVKMREFPQAALLSAMLGRNAITPGLLQTLAAIIADFHAIAPSAIATPGVNTGVGALAPALDNFRQMLPLLQDSADIAAAEKLQAWTLHEHHLHASLFTQRLAAGRVRECHGDLHLGNIALIDDRPTPFDCIEFDPVLRWIDVMSEVAFVVMDLEAQQRRDLAGAFLNAYLEASGDYSGLAVLRFYLVYRAMVRLKIALIRARQQGTGMRACRDYLKLASGCCDERRGAVIITHGPPGSGKTTLTQQAIAALGALRVRSDIERKRLHGLSALEPSGSGIGSGMYDATATASTYRQLARHARSVSAAGWPVIVDATFLKHAQRAEFRALAAELGVPFVIASFEAAPEALRARVAARAAHGGDASEATPAVLDAQIAGCDALTAEESACTIRIDSTADISTGTRALTDNIRQRIAS